eukprot:TRINITY_DN32048_c0_g1_i1.p1 TRINITY_DN32048_c0_g1~~TRINITY_DN32048_c0_g1_i1.p1  ORF type:complete len:233 (+),score=51.81 TRINITY_DN32048_c0_g1_i1:67-765(+)
MSRFVALLALAASASALQISGSVPTGSTNQMQGPMNTEENMPAWSSADMTLRNIAPHLIGGEYIDLGAVTDVGSTVTVKASPDKPAMLYAFVYGCYPCPGTDGGLMGHLLNNDDWRLGYCAPVFHSAMQGRSFRQIAFAKDIPANTEYTLTLPGNTEYVAFVATDTFTNCPAQSGTDKATCEGASVAPEQHCKWDAITSSCKFAFCHGNVGPSIDVCSVPDACAPSGSTYVR